MEAVTQIVLDVAIEVGEQSMIWSVTVIVNGVAIWRFSKSARGLYDSDKDQLIRGCTVGKI